MSSDDVRAVRFQKRFRGYYASEVDDLLRRVAAELDAGRPVVSLIENTQFPRPGRAGGMTSMPSTGSWISSAFPRAIRGQMARTPGATWAR